MRVLVVDIGGTHVKVLATGQQVPREFPSGPTLTAEQMVDGVKRVAAECAYDAVSIGFPGPVLHGRPLAEPRHLGGGWLGFDYLGAFGCLVKVVDDAVRRLIAALEPEDVVLGGGNIHQLETLPPGCRAGDNSNAFVGGFRLWERARVKRHASRAVR